MLQNTTTLCF